MPSLFKMIRYGYRIFRNARFLHTNITFTARSSIIDDPYERFPKYFRNKIIYSSYMENQKPKLGYKKTKIEESKFLNELNRKRQESSHMKPFPIALQSICDSKIIRTTDIGNPTIKEHSEEIYEHNSERPGRWMEEYEFYNSGEDTESSFYGTSDINEPPSKVPCNGCGAHLQCAESSLPGYIPCEIYKNRTDNELKLLTCQRCHFLKNYNIALDINVSPETYVKTISSIKDKHALAIIIVDLLDFPCSIWPQIQTILGDKRPVFVVGNKVDLLPKDSKGYLEHIKNCLRKSILKTGLNELNIKYISLISAKTGYGIEELITQLHKIWKYKGDVYLVGCTNVGKSSLFNALLRSDYCKVEASDLVKKATTCPWPGTTLQMLKFPILRPSDYRIFQRCKRLSSERLQRQAEEKLRSVQLRKSGKHEYATLIGHIGRTFIQAEETNDIFAMSKGVKPILTLDENSKNYSKSRWCFDTPGVIQNDQIQNLLTTEELLLTNPRETITPRVFRIKPSMTLFLAGLGRLDFINSDIHSIRIAVYASSKLPILVTYTDSATEVYKELLGTEVLRVPQGSKHRIERWPTLKCNGEFEIIGNGETGATCDVILSSAGWIAVHMPKQNKGVFQAWTPDRRGIFLRDALIPHGDLLRGKKIRDSVAYRLGNSFIKQ